MSNIFPAEANFRFFFFLGGEGWTVKEPPSESPIITCYNCLLEKITKR